MPWNFTANCSSDTPQRDKIIDYYLLRSSVSVTVTVNVTSTSVGPRMRERTNCFAAASERRSAAATRRAGGRPAGCVYNNSVDHDQVVVSAACEAAAITYRRSARDTDSRKPTAVVVSLKRLLCSSLCSVSIISHYVITRPSPSCFASKISIPVSYHIIISYQKFIVRPLLREPGPWVH